VVAVSDVTGATRNVEGLDLTALEYHVQHTRGVKGFAGGEDFAGEQLLFEPCDVLVPAALGNVLTKDNAADVRAHVILEGANHPTDPAADEIFKKRNITVIPDVYANAGGVTVSYFEWVQNIQAFRWDEARVNDELRRVMARAWKDLAQATKSYGSTFRAAAFALAIARVAHATELRGV
jgi:glutamate dehydrogenase (NAD(P)+)